MPHFLISFDAHAMDHVSEQDRPAVAEAAHSVIQEAIDAGVYVFAGGLEERRASIVATDGTVSDGPLPAALGGATLLDVPNREVALGWAAKIAAACRCPQEVWEFMDDPELARMLDQTRGES